MFVESYRPPTPVSNNKISPFILENAKIYNFLIGESLLKSQDIGLKLKQFTQITL